MTHPITSLGALSPEVVIETKPDADRTYEFLRQWIAGADARAARRKAKTAV